MPSKDGKRLSNKCRCHHDVGSKASLSKLSRVGCCAFPQTAQRKDWLYGIKQDVWSVNPSIR